MKTWLKAIGVVIGCILILPVGLLVFFGLFWLLTEINHASELAGNIVNAGIIIVIILVVASQIKKDFE